MGNKKSIFQNTQNSSQPEERASQDENCGSPILFPSQEESKNDKVKKDENDEEEDDCFEIVDIQTDHQDDIEEVKNMSSRTSLTKIPKGKARLSLGKKRQIHVDDDNKDVRGNGPKVRRQLLEENGADLKAANEEKPSIVAKKEPQRMHPLMLSRPYRCNHKVCQTLEDADTTDLYFAPVGIERSDYSKVIVRKFETYRQRLYQAQSRLRRRHPDGDLVEPKVLEARRQRPLSRQTRASVLMKNTQEIKTRSDSNKVNKDANDQTENLVKTKVLESSSNSRVNEQPAVEIVPDTSQVENTRTSPNNATMPEKNDVSERKEDYDDDDVVETLSCSDGLSKSRERASPLTSSPVRPTLRKSLIRTILDETSSDEESISFSLKKPNPTNSAEKAKQESVIVSTNELQTDSGAKEQIQKSLHECPICFKMFSEDKIHTHAAICNGISEPRTRSSRDKPLLVEDDVVENKVIDKKSQVRYDYSKTQEEEKMSPIIKVRTPTKVRELKLMSPSVGVRNLVHEFSSPPRSGERVQMFGVKVVLSPRVAAANLEKMSDGKNERFGSSTEIQKKAEEMSTSDVNVAFKDNPRCKKLNCLETTELETKTVGNEKHVDVRETRRKQKLLNAKESETKTTKAPRRSQESTRNLIPRTSTRNSMSGNGNHSRRPSDDRILKENFIPLQVEDEGSQSEDKMGSSLPSKNVTEKRSSVTSISSSEDEQRATETIIATAKALNDTDDNSALDLIVGGYKGRKRKRKAVGVARRKRSNNRVTLEEDGSLQYCFLCEQYIPTEMFPEHVDEEIKQKKKSGGEDCNVAITSSHSTDERDVSTSRTRSALRRRSSPESKGRKICLPDLAEATTSRVSDTCGDESPLKTFTPINQCSNPNIDYYNQFSFTGHGKNETARSSKSSRKSSDRSVKNQRLRGGNLKRYSLRK